MAKARIKYHANEHSILYGETGGCCPLCRLSMMFKKANSKHPTIGYEIAHIYPLNPNPVQAKALERYPAPDDINALDNVILLCPTCHTKYDKDFKIEEYSRLRHIKDGYLSETQARLTASQYVLQDEVKEILDLIASSDESYGDLSETKLDVSSLNEKLKTGISPLQKRDSEKRYRFFRTNQKTYSSHRAAGSGGDKNIAESNKFILSCYGKTAPRKQRSYFQLYLNMDMFKNRKISFSISNPCLFFCSKL